MVCQNSNGPKCDPSGTLERGRSSQGRALYFCPARFYGAAVFVEGKERSEMKGYIIHSPLPDSGRLNRGKY
jgi:hypothetical protein